MSKETKEPLPIEITEEERKQYEERCVELATKYNVPKVHVCVQVKDDELNTRVVSYFKEPNYMTKLGLMDKAGTVGIHMAADELRLICQLKEESDPLTYSEHFTSDVYKLGLAQYCIGIIELISDKFKKK